MNIAKILKEKFENSNKLRKQLKLKKGYNIKSVFANIINKTLEDVIYENDTKTYKTEICLYINLEFINSFGELDMRIASLKLEVSFTLDKDYNIDFSKITCIN